MTKEYKVLTPEQVDQWMEKGYVSLPGAVKPEYIQKWTEDIWIRLGYDPNDKSTWEEDRMHMPWHYAEHARIVAPKAWDAICDLLGGEDRVDEYCAGWRNNIILNLGSPEYTEKIEPPELYENWHVDGDWFRHYLDSPEQALLVVVLWGDVKPGGGPTYICPEGMGRIAKVFLDRPEGVLSPQYNGGFPWASVMEPWMEHIPMTGKAGDVVILHPHMLHTASKNYLREPRFMTNPPVMVKEPFNFNRENPEDYSLVELKTLKGLGVDKVDFKPTGPRDKQIVSPRHAITSVRLQKELERLKAHSEKTGKPMDSLRLAGAPNIPW